MRHSRRLVRLGARVAGIAVLGLSLSGCFRAAALFHQQASPDTRPWWCDAMMSGEGHRGSEWYMDRGIEKGQLSWDDCIAVSKSFDEALQFATHWPTRGEAEADGWRASVNYAAGLGTHHALGSPLAGTFDPTRPTFLQYGGNSPDAKLVGISWFVNNGPDAPPEGFPGDNDWWHQHPQLCISNTTGLVIFDGPCPPGVNGTTVNLQNYWLLHAWIVPGWFHEPDVFIGEHPCLLPGGPAEHDDPCWEFDHMEMGHEFAA